MHEKEVKSILSPKNGMNLYRGCTHGCIYCDSRSNCYNMQHPFEDIEVKSNAIELLEKALKGKRKKCMIGTGAMTDPYLHLEEKLCHTRKSLELIDKYGFGISIQTKSDLILRDLDLLKKINEKTKAVVQITLTTYDESLCKIIEPNVATTKRRVEVLNILRDNNIPTIVWMTPMLPFINDTKENIQGLLQYCIQAKVSGILIFGIGVTLRDGDREYFYQKLDKHFPGLKKKYIEKYGNSYEVMSEYSMELTEIVYTQCKNNNIMVGTKKIFEYMHEFECKSEKAQMSIFEFME